MTAAGGTSFTFVLYGHRLGFKREPQWTCIERGLHLGIVFLESRVLPNRTINDGLS